jgi:uncharacterized protein
MKQLLGKAYEDQYLVRRKLETEKKKQGKWEVSLKSCIEEQFVSVAQAYGQTQTKLMYDKILKTRPLPQDLEELKKMDVEKERKI